MTAAVIIVASIIRHSWLGSHNTVSADWYRADWYRTSCVCVYVTFCCWSISCVEGRSDRCNVSSPTKGTHALSSSGGIMSCRLNTHLAFLGTYWQPWLLWSNRRSERRSIPVRDMGSIAFCWQTVSSSVLCATTRRRIEPQSLPSFDNGGLFVG